MEPIMGRLVKDYMHLKSSSDVHRSIYGARARRLFLLKSMNMPVPRVILLSINTVRKIQAENKLDIEGILENFKEEDIFSVSFVNSAVSSRNLAVQCFEDFSSPPFSSICRFCIKIPSFEILFNARSIL